MASKWKRGACLPGEKVALMSVGKLTLLGPYFAVLFMLGLRASALC